MADDDGYRGDRGRFGADEGRFRRAGGEFARGRGDARESHGGGRGERSRYGQDREGHGRGAAADYGRPGYGGNDQGGRREDDDDHERQEERRPGGARGNFGGDRPVRGGSPAADDIGGGAYGGSYVGNQGRGYGYGYGGEGERGRNAQAYDEQPDRGFMERAADSVASWFGDEDAGRRLEKDHRGRGPKGYKRSNDRIREDVSDRLYDDPHVDASDIEVAVSGGEVTLTGTVDDRNARRRAEDVAERVSGVTYVQNNLRVRRPGSPPGSPAAETPVAGLDPAKAGGTVSPASTNLGSSGGTATGLGATGGTLPGTGAAGAGSVADPSTAGSSHRTTGL